MIINVIEGINKNLHWVILNLHKVLITGFWAFELEPGVL